MPSEQMVVVTPAGKVKPKYKEISVAICRLCSEILTDLGYAGKGDWTINLNRHITKRSDFRFQVIQKCSRAILCRVKPGDNGTCWTVYLNPPQGLLVHQVYDDLRMVKPNGEVTRNTWGPKIQTPGIGKSRIPQQVDPLERRHVEALLTPPKVTKPEPTKPTPQITQVVTPTPQPEPVTAPAPQASTPPPQLPAKESELPVKPYVQVSTIAHKPPLAIPAHIQAVGEDPLALDHGLVALTFGIDSGPEGHILRPTATQLLIQELGLEEFTNQNNHYSDPTKVASALVKGLCNRGYLTRWFYPVRKDLQRTTAKKGGYKTTKGFTLSPSGRQRIEQLRSKLPPNLAARLYRPDLVIIEKHYYKLQQPEESQIRIQTYHTFQQPVQPQQPTVTQAAEAAFRQLEPLLSELNQRRRSIEEFDALIAGYRERQIQHDAESEMVRNKLAEVKSEFQKLEDQMKLLHAAREKDLNDMRAAEALKNEEAAALDIVRVQLDDALYATAEVRLAATSNK